MKSFEERGHLMTGTDVRFLLVDDDEVDLMAVKRAFRERKVANPLLVARDGIEALEMLRGNDVPAQVDKPYIILLDLNMPRMNGIEFLQNLRKDPRHKDAVVFVLTTSQDEFDISRAYELNVAGYIVKSRLSEQFVDIVTMLDYYWRIVELPSS